MNCLQKYSKTRSIERRPGSGRPTKMTAAVRALMEQQMRNDDETTAVQLHALLQRHGYTMTLKTILRCRAALGWTFRGSAYCQLIRQCNKAKRLQWAQQHLSDGFNDVIWTDECSVQTETHCHRAIDWMAGSCNGWINALFCRLADRWLDSWESSLNV